MTWLAHPHDFPYSSAKTLVSFSWKWLLCLFVRNGFLQVFSNVGCCIWTPLKYQTPWMLNPNKMGLPRYEWLTLPGFWTASYQWNWVVHLPSVKVKFCLSFSLEQPLKLHRKWQIPFFHKTLQAKCHLRTLTTWQFPVHSPLSPKPFLGKNMVPKCHSITLVLESFLQEDEAKLRRRLSARSGRSSTSKRQLSRHTDSLKVVIVAERSDPRGDCA